MVSWLVMALQLYLVAGVLFGLGFVLRGVDRIDPQAAESSWGFRVMIFPGAVALWPLLLRRWIGGVDRPEERNAHRRAAATRRSR